MKKFAFPLLCVLFSLALIFLAGEVICRANGYRPWAPLDPKRITIHPGSSLYQPDTELGYVQRPGPYKITMPSGYTFTATHQENGLRVTHIDEGDDAESRPEIWIFGCSFTYGWSLNDHETYAWKLQEDFPDFEVVNFGVGAYSTVQSVLQFQSAARKREKKPALVVLAYASMHDERNTSLRSWRKMLVTYDGRNELLLHPYARFGENQKIEFKYRKQEFNEFPLSRRSALMHFLEDVYIQWEARTQKSQNVSKAMVVSMARFCEKNNIPFVLAGIDSDRGTREVLLFCRKMNIPAVDISVNLFRPGYRNLPHDTHPSALANKFYAEKLGAYLNRVL